MTLSPQRRPERRNSARRVNRRPRLHASAVGAAVAPNLLSGVWRARRPKVVAFLAVLVLLGVLIAFFDSEAFYVYDFQVAGLQNLERSEVQNASGVLSYNIFFVDRQTVERALRRLPEVKSVRVEARLTNQVAITLEERRPALTWQRGAETYWADADGIVLRMRANLPQLPVIRDLDQAAVKPGGLAQPEAVAALRALRDAWPEGPRLFEWSSANGLAFTDEHGWKIYLGSADDMAGKVAKLRALVAQLLAKNVKLKFIDLGKGDPYYQ